jgi:hypothetical protein
MDMLEISPQLLREAKLSVNDMATYLTEYGWKQIPNQNQRVTIFQGINDDFGNPIVLTLPRNDNFGEALNLVAFLENRWRSLSAQADASRTERESPESLMVDVRDRSVKTIDSLVLRIYGTGAPRPNLDRQ